MPQVSFFFLMIRLPPKSKLFPYTTLFRSGAPEMSLEANFFELGGNSLLATQLIGRLRERSEEHTSELQSRVDLVCRLLLEKKNKQKHSALSRSRHARNHKSNSNSLDAINY